MPPMTDEELLQIAADHVGKRDAADFSELDLITTERGELIAFGRAAIAAHEAARVGLHCHLDDDGPCPSPCVFDDPAEQISNCTYAQGLQRDGKPKTACPYYRTATAETAPVLNPEEVETRFRAWIEQEHGLIPSQTATTYAAAFALHMLRGEVK